MSVTLSDVETSMEAAVAAISSGDYDSALDYALAAQGYLAVIPDQAKAGERIAWPEDRIDGFVKNIRRRLAGSTGIQTSKVTYARPSD